MLGAGHSRVCHIAGATNGTVRYGYIYEGFEGFERFERGTESSRCHLMRAFFPSSYDPHYNSTRCLDRERERTNEYRYDTHTTSIYSMEPYSSSIIQYIYIYVRKKRNGSKRFDRGGTGSQLYPRPGLSSIGNSFVCAAPYWMPHTICLLRPFEDATQFAVSRGNTVCCRQQVFCDSTYQVGITNNNNKISEVYMKLFLFD